MQGSATVEQRLSELERQVDELKRELARRRREENWIEKVSGRFENDPVFDEIVRLGAEIRRADRPGEDD